MYKPTPEQIKQILADHALWYRDRTGGRRADFSDTDLRGADLRGADLRDADLQEANLNGALLRGADLRGASLWGADLQGAVLHGAALHGAALHGADLRDAKLPSFQLPQGELIVYKRIAGYVTRWRIPHSAKRTACLVGRKCRAEYGILEEIEGTNKHSVRGGRRLDTYMVGETFHPDSYDDDIRVECTHGLHFFLTREEALNW